MPSLLVLTSNQVEELKKIYPFYNKPYEDIENHLSAYSSQDGVWAIGRSKAQTQNEFTLFYTNQNEIVAQKILTDDQVLPQNFDELISCIESTKKELLKPLITPLTDDMILFEQAAAQLSNPTHLAVLVPQSFTKKPIFQVNAADFKNDTRFDNFVNFNVNVIDGIHYKRLGQIKILTRKENIILLASGRTTNFFPQFVKDHGGSSHAIYSLDGLEKEFSKLSKQSLQFEYTLKPEFVCGSEHFVDMNEADFAVIKKSYELKGDKSLDKRWFVRYQSDTSVQLQIAYFDYSSKQNSIKFFNLIKNNKNERYSFQYKNEEISFTRIYDVVEGIESKIPTLGKGYLTKSKPIDPNEWIKIKAIAHLRFTEACYKSLGWDTAIVFIDKTIEINLVHDDDQLTGLVQIKLIDNDRLEYNLYITVMDLERLAQGKNILGIALSNPGLKFNFKNIIQIKSETTPAPKATTGTLYESGEELVQSSSRSSKKDEYSEEDSELPNSSDAYQDDESVLPQPQLTNLAASENPKTITKLISVEKSKKSSLYTEEESKLPITNERGKQTNSSLGLYASAGNVTQFSAPKTILFQTVDDILATQPKFFDSKIKKEDAEEALKQDTMNQYNFITRTSASCPNALGISYKIDEKTFHNALDKNDLIKSINPTFEKMTKETAQKKLEEAVATGISKLVEGSVKAKFQFVACDISKAFNPEARNIGLYTS